MTTLAGDLAVALCRAPEQTLNLIALEYPPEKVRQAREDLAMVAELSALLDPGEAEPAPQPDNPRAIRWCRWCGRSDPPGGLRDGPPPAPQPPPPVRMVPYKETGISGPGAARGS